LIFKDSASLQLGVVFILFITVTEFKIMLSGYGY